MNAIFHHKYYTEAAYHRSVEDNVNTVQWTYRYMEPKEYTNWRNESPPVVLAHLPN